MPHGWGWCPGKTPAAASANPATSLLRCCLVLGATNLLRLAGGKAPPPQLAWATKLLQKKSFRLTSVALANKMARTIWAILTTGESYDPDRWSDPTAAVARQDRADLAA